MGEWSKKSGEKGEEILENFFKTILGYNTINANASLECIKNEKHKRKTAKSPRRTHGIDGLLSAKSPLEDNVLDILVVSSKFTSKKYPNSPKYDFKEHITDLAHTLECFKYSKLYSATNKRYSQIQRTDITGILLWLSNESHESESIIPKISNSQLDSSLVFDKILVIDNDRINFFTETILNAKKIYGNDQVDFIYHNTSLNNTGLSTFSYGKFLPVNYIYSDLIPLRVKNGENIDLILYSKDNFNEEHFSQLLGFAKNFDHLDATHRVILSFPDYNESEYTSIINTILSDFDNFQLDKNLYVKSHLLNFKNQNHD